MKSPQLNNPYASDDWGTPQKIFDILDDRYDFTLDAAASELNHKCRNYYTREDDALTRNWKGESVFINPPYTNGQLPVWVKKVYTEALYSTMPKVLLIPANTDTGYFSDYVSRADTLMFIRGRLKFEVPREGGGLEVSKYPARFGSCIAVFNDMLPQGVVWVDRDLNLLVGQERIL